MFGGSFCFHIVTESVVPEDCHILQNILQGAELENVQSNGKKRFLCYVDPSQIGQNKLE